MVQSLSTMLQRICFWHGISCLAILSLSVGARADAPRPAKVQFNRDIRPILSDNCFFCHGPDKARRKAKLRFDTPEGPFVDRGGSAVIVPGDLRKSEMFRRVTASDPKERMPPPDSGRSLNPRQVELIRRWIDQGAKWQKHWSLISPERPALASVVRPPGLERWPRNAIDRYILDRHQTEGLIPAPEADRTSLIRRLTLDLTGLPPTPVEVESFLADQAPDAYEKVVDRLLASPRFGERMAVPWLDAARYADTNGYQSDGERTMWRWRDWVIDAFNGNMPFDQFTIEQLAGDMLPGATLDQKIASGFNRNHRGNAEGGIIPEEYAVEYVVDRVETVTTVWLGLTMGCARCHDHKFDPIKQKDFYKVFAYFNNVPERGKAIKYGNSPPLIKSPTPDQQKQLRLLEDKLAAQQRLMKELEPRIAAAQTEWEHMLPSAPALNWFPETGLVAHYDLDGNTDDRTGHAKPGRFRHGEPGFGPGRLHKAAAFDGKRFIDAGNVGDFGFYDKFSFSMWALMDGPKGGTLLSRMTDAPQAEGYCLYLEDGKVQVNLVKRWLDDALRVETERRLVPNRWHHIAATYDGTRVASGLKIYIDGVEEKTHILLDDLNQTFQLREPLRIGGGGGPGGRFHGLIDEVAIYRGALQSDQVEVLATIDSISKIVTIAPAQRTPQQVRKLRAYFLAHPAPPGFRQAHARLVSLRRDKQKFIESFPTTMVMKEMEKPRDTFVLIRGAYDKHGEKVGPGTPDSLPPLPTGLPNSRLGLARWVVDRSNPLTARVVVNRFWQMLFGNGIVKSVGDFGSQGDWPTHPELLDWLAVEFMDTGWDVKAIIRKMVTSSTYRQSSKITPALLQKDPENRFLARAGRFRLSAETVRDQALAASGLLVEELGGPSVKPYQPAGLWKELADTDYIQDKGPSLYRRSMYTFWKRTVPPPAMIAFDAAGRETCIVRETRTNTPLQALDLMNDITYVEAARVLAERVMSETADAPAQRVALAFRLVMARSPQPAELEILCKAFEDHLARYRRYPQEALKFTAVGEIYSKPALDRGELAAYSTVASMILNLDEAITRP